MKTTRIVIVMLGVLIGFYVDQGSASSTFSSSSGSRAMNSRHPSRMPRSVRRPASDSSRAQGDYVVYSVSQALSLSDDPKFKSPKDYYINMGQDQGVRPGSVLEVRRRVSTYDLMTEQLYRDMFVPVARVKVIHVEPMASIARIESLSSSVDHPVVSPQEVMVGDLVRFPR